MRGHGYYGNTVIGVAHQSSSKKQHSVQKKISWWFRVSSANAVIWPGERYYQVIDQSGERVYTLNEYTYYCLIRNNLN